MEKYVRLVWGFRTNLTKGIPKLTEIWSLAQNRNPPMELDTARQT
eukprot:gene516-1799_t